MADTCQNVGRLTQCTYCFFLTHIVTAITAIKCKRFLLVWLQYVHAVAPMKTTGKVIGESVFFSQMLLFSLLSCCTQHHIVRRKMEAILCCVFIKNVFALQPLLILTLNMPHH